MATAVQTGTEIQNFIDGEKRARRRRQRAGPQPGQRRNYRVRPAVRRGGRRRRRAGREARLSGMVRDPARRARPSAAAIADALEENGEELSQSSPPNVGKPIETMGEEIPVLSTTSASSRARLGSTAAPPASTWLATRR